MIATLLIICAVAAIIGGVFYYFNQTSPLQTSIPAWSFAIAILSGAVALGGILFS